MLTYDAWTFPTGETHMPERMAKKNLRIEGRLTYQYPLYLQALSRCRQRKVAVDVGAHVGLLSYFMVRDFGQVVAFEPVEAHRACWTVNVPHREQDHLHACALGAASGSVRLEPVTPMSTGGSYVAGDGPIPMHTLDRFSLRCIDLLKIDCEGYELDVVRGGKASLIRCKPVVIVEQRPRVVTRYGYGPTDAVKRLQRLGATVAWTDRSDYVLVFP
jgi:FkbM family methyltransferase